jgi:hypothetical protein
MIKKRYIFGLIICSALAYLYFPTKPHIIINDSHKDEKSAFDKTPKKNEVLEFSERVFASEKLKDLSIANAQCKSNNKNYSVNVRSIISILTDTLEEELRSGVSERTLLAYQDQFPTFYQGFEDILREAKIRIEREKYTTTNSIEILNLWSGLSVVNGFNAINVPLIVEATASVDLQNSGIQMGLELNSDLSEDEVIALLNNTEHFNTYLYSPFHVNGAPLSPSVLFVLTASALDIEIYKAVISLQSFNVNDVAVAIVNGIPSEYLSPLLAQTRNVEDMPIFYQTDYDSYNNLADFAAANHNVDALIELARYGVTPTNEPGIITGLDIALKNLPSKNNPVKQPGKNTNKYIETINYLVKQGYKAHGSLIDFEDESIIFFDAPNSRLLTTEDVSDPALRSPLRNIDLIDKSEWIAQIPADGSQISKAIEEIDVRKKTLNASNVECEEIRKELILAEGFADDQEREALLGEVANQDNAAQRLHDIDPALVRYADTSNHWAFNSEDAKGEGSFLGMLKKGEYDEALIYSVSQPLTEHETDQLLWMLAMEPEALYPIWKARITHTPPTALGVFRRMPMEQWRYLLREGFDFSLQDIWGNDFFAPAGMHSKETVALLLENGFVPNFDNVGLDAIDIVLEESYEKGRLNESVVLLLAQTQKLEANHYARIARLKRYFPDAYRELIEADKRFVPPANIEPNRYRGF